MSGKCRLCPRKCGVDRSITKGYCGETDKLRIANYQLHQWEEPVISGSSGAGTVFFSGCVMKCVFCQNYQISSLGTGYEITEQRLAEIFLELQSKGASCIDLVNPTHFVPQIKSALDKVKSSLHIPIVYNSGGYELPETIDSLAGYIDVFLPDLKYFSDDLAKKYSLAGGYFSNAIASIREMVSVAGKPVICGGILVHGVMVRHLVLPNHRQDSIELLRRLGGSFAPDEILISLMSQYLPVYRASEFPELSRRLSTFEYDSVVKEARKFGWDGFIQERSSASDYYIPDFSSEPL